MVAESSSAGIIPVSFVHAPVAQRHSFRVITTRGDVTNPRRA
jgi:hypothetical protein